MSLGEVAPNVSYTSIGETVPSLDSRMSSDYCFQVLDEHLGSL